jgi:hypothetical protein
MKLLITGLVIVFLVGGAAIQEYAEDADGFRCPHSIDGMSTGCKWINQPLEKDTPNYIPARGPQTRGKKLATQLFRNTCDSIGMSAGHQANLLEFARVEPNIQEHIEQKKVAMNVKKMFGNSRV